MFYTLDNEENLTAKQIIQIFLKRASTSPSVIPSKSLQNRNAWIVIDALLWSYVTTWVYDILFLKLH